MLQQINLYQKALREERKPLCAGTVGASLIAIAVCSLALWGFGTWKLRTIAAQVATVKNQQQEQERFVSATAETLAAKNNPVELNARIKALKLQIADRANALALLRGGAAGETTGFARRLEALAHQHVPGLWLDRMVLAGDAHALSLSGRSIDADLVPHYLMALAQEPVLAGARFDEFVIERGKQNNKTVQFKAASASLAINDKKEEQGT
jgi:hypothetical protein